MSPLFFAAAPQTLEIIVMLNLFLFLVFVLCGSAQANDRFDSIHMDKHCGPVPWEAYQVAKFSSSGENHQEVNAGGEVNTVTQTGSGNVGVKNGKSFEHDGESVALPVSGEQWTAMYLTYMSCVVRVNKGDDVGQMWKDALKAGAIKDVDDISTFMRSAGTLMNPSADAWWKEFKTLMNNEFMGQNARLEEIMTSLNDYSQAETDQAVQLAAHAEAAQAMVVRVDTLYLDVRELREHYIELKAAHAALESAFNDFKAHESELDTKLGERLKKLEKQMDELHDVVNLLTTSIKAKADNS